MYACYLLVGKSWKLHEIVENFNDVTAFLETTQSMMKARLLGLPINGYDVHELQNQAKTAVEAEDPMKITAGETYNYIRHIQTRFALDDAQLSKMLNSEQLDDMIRAMQLGRPDQVTVMLYQDGILARKTPK